MLFVSPMMMSQGIVGAWHFFVMNFAGQSRCCPKKLRGLLLLSDFSEFSVWFVSSSNPHLSLFKFDVGSRNPQFWSVQSQF